MANSLPDWPRRLSAPLAAAYCGLSVTAFKARVDKHLYPNPIRDGGRVLWDRRLLDKVIDAQSDLVDAEDDGGWSAAIGQD